jgi:O-antigen/teichoic acid export membrane protein
MPSSAQRVFRHTLFQIASRAIGTALGLTAVSLIGRSLGTSGFGAYTTITAYLSVFAILADFGVSTTVVAMLSEKDADEESLARNALGLRIALTLGGLLAAIAIVPFTPYSTEIKYGIVLMTLSFFGISINQIQTAFFQRHVRMDRPAIAEIIGRILLVLGIWLAIRMQSGLTGILLAVIFSNLLHAGIAACFLKGIAPFRPCAHFAVWRSILARSWPVGASIALNLIYLRADTVILSWTHSQTEVGVYGMAYRVIDVLTVLPMLFMGIVLPFLASAWSHNDTARFSRTLTQALNALVLGAAPLTAGALVLGPDLLAFVAGEPFRASGHVLQLLIFGVAAIFVGAAFTHTIVALQAQRHMLLPLAIDAILSLALYVLLIPRYGMWAAGSVTVFSEIFAAGAAMVIAYRSSKTHPSWNIPVRAVVAAGMMALVLFAVPTVPLALRLLLGVVVYSVAAFAVGAVRPATIRELLSVKNTST